MNSPQPIEETQQAEGNKPQRPKAYASTATRREQFLASLKASGSMSAAAAAVAKPGATSIGLRSWYNLRKSDPAFDRQCAEQVEVYTDGLRDEAYRRAVLGVERITVQKGHVVMEIDPNDPDKLRPVMQKEFSDRLLEILLKRHDKFFRDKTVEHKHSGHVTHAHTHQALPHEPTVTLSLSDMQILTNDERTALAGILRKIGRANAEEPLMLDAPVSDDDSVVDAEFTEDTPSVEDSLREWKQNEGLT